LLARILFGAQQLKELVKGYIFFGQDDRGRATSDTAVHGNVTRVPSHHLNEEKPVMRQRRISDLVYCVYRGVGSRVITDRKIGSGNIVVDCARDTDRRQTVLLIEFMKTGKCAVAS